MQPEVDGGAVGAMVGAAVGAALVGEEVGDAVLETATTSLPGTPENGMAMSLSFLLYTKETVTL